MSDTLELLLAEIDLLKAEWQLQSLALDEPLRQKLDIECTYHSNRLEGSSLSLRETEMVIGNGLMLPGKPVTENLAALNHYQAIQFVRDQANEQNLLSEDLIKQIHVILLRAIHKQHAGRYRVEALQLANGDLAPPPDQLPTRIAEDIHWLGLEGPFLHPIIFAAEAHLRLQKLQLFQEGNGLCARLVMNLILLQEGYPLISIASDDHHRQAYFNALGQALGAQDKNAWLCYIAETAKTNCQNLLRRLQEDDKIRTD